MEQVVDDLQRIGERGQDRYHGFHQLQLTVQIGRTKTVALIPPCLLMSVEVLVGRAADLPGGELTVELPRLSHVVAERGGQEHDVA